MTSPSQSRASDSRLPVLQSSNGLRGAGVPPAAGRLHSWGRRSRLPRPNPRSGIIRLFRCRSAIAAVLALTAALCAAAPPLTIRNAALTIQFRPAASAYAVFASGQSQPVLVAQVGAEVNGRWVLSSAYPRHSANVAPFHNALGAGQALTFHFSGLAGEPDLICRLRLYAGHPYGDVRVTASNATGATVSVQALRLADATSVNLGAAAVADRVLAETVSEDPSARIGGLAQAPPGGYVAYRDLLVYNRASRRSLLLAGLTARRFLTVARLAVVPAGTAIAGLTLDDTGTTRAMLPRDPIPFVQRMYLNLPLAPGAVLHSEVVMIAVGPGFLPPLQRYGAAVRQLHGTHFSCADAPTGWWSWTAFYGGITAGEVWTNAQWLAAHLKDLGYDYVHVDEGYDYARGEYTTANATQFPHGMWRLEHRIRGLGLIPGIWTAPFEVSARAWVYQHHPDWLLHDAHGQPILVGYVHGHVDPLYVLDTTNPGAQRYLRRTYRILTRQWGVRYIKLDFMDAAAVEGDYYRPGTTAIQAQRIGLRIIRQAVGPHVLLDKDGSLMLPPVGFVNEGRIAPDTGHSFAASRDAVTNIASRFYMNGNFFVADPDAFSVSRQIEPQQHWHESQSGLTRDEAQVQIVLAAMAGGMFEIGDDLPTLAAEPRRLALVENQQIIDLNRLGRSALPLDLMTFPLQDAAPSVFYLREDRRQAMLAVFNWTAHPTSHRIVLAQLDFPQGDPLRAYDVLNGNAPVVLAGGALRIRAQAPRSVRLIELDDAALPPRRPNVTAEAPAAVRVGQAVTLQAHLAAGSPPVMSYRWDFGDGTAAAGPDARHTYTHAGTFSITLTARGLAGVQGARMVRHLTIRVTGFPRTRFTLRQNRRYRPVQ